MRFRESNFIVEVANQQSTGNKIDVTSEMYSCTVSVQSNSIQNELKCSIEAVINLNLRMLGTPF